MIAVPEVRKLAAIMFTDIQGYTAMVQQDEDEALRKVAVHRRCLEQFTSQYQGSVIEFYGDGSLSIYDSVVDAVRCAIAMQLAYHDNDDIPVRIGIHLGDFVRKEGTVFGDAINVASRIQAQGIPGAILISEKVQRELVNHSDIATIFLGGYKLRNVQELVRIHAIKAPGVTVPKRKNNIAHKARSSRQFIIPLIAILVTVIAVRYFAKSPVTDGTLREDRIAVPEFKDLTARPEYDVVAKMAAHWITTELIESVHASVVSYQSAVENIQTAYASSSPERFSDRTGAINVINGAYRLIGSDSLEFSATILNLKTGLHRDVVLPRPHCTAADPMVCIQELANGIKGFWKSRSDHVLKPPKYDAYEAYLDARSKWLRDPSEAEKLLRTSIALDPEFIDAYFLLLDGLYNQRRYADAAEMLDEMKAHFPNMTKRQSDYYLYYKSDNEGKNTNAFNYFLNEYAIDPKDIFVNTSGMVMASEYVNDPRKVLEFFAEISPDSLDLSQCTYCQNRIAIAIAAYHATGKTRNATALASKLRPYVQDHRNFQKLVEFYVATGDTASANQILSEAMQTVPQPYRPYLYLVAGKQAQLKNDTGLRNHYASRSAQHAPDSSRALARSLYLMEDFDSALAVYRQALQRDSTDSRIYAEMGLIFARQKNTAEAERMISILTTLKEPFDYGNTAYFQGRIAAHLGDRQKALALLETSLNEGNKFFSSVTYMQDPDLMVLHGDPQFKKMLKRI